MAAIVKRLAADFGLARSNAGFARLRATDDLPDEQLHAYLAPLAESEHRARELERCVAQLEPAPLLADRASAQATRCPDVARLGYRRPVLRASRAEWLRDTIPGVDEIVEIDDARLFFPDERPADLVPHLLRHWKAHET